MHGSQFYDVNGAAVTEAPFQWNFPCSRFDCTVWVNIWGIYEHINRRRTQISWSWLISGDKQNPMARKLHRRKWMHRLTSYRMQKNCLMSASNYYKLGSSTISHSSALIRFNTEKYWPRPETIKARIKFFEMPSQNANRSVAGGHNRQHMFGAWFGVCIERAMETKRQRSASLIASIYVAHNTPRFCHIIWKQSKTRVKITWSKIKETRLSRAYLWVSRHSLVMRTFWSFLFGYVYASAQMNCHQMRIGDVCGFTLLP